MADILNQIDESIARNAARFDPFGPAPLPEPVKSSSEGEAVEPEAVVEAPALGERQFMQAFAEIAADREAVEAVIAEAFATGGIVTRAPILGVTTPGDPWSDIVDTYQRIRDNQGDRQPFFMPVVEAEAARMEEAIRLELNAYPQRWIPLAPPAPLVDELEEPESDEPVDVHRYECPHSRCDWTKVALDRGLLLDLAEEHELQAHAPRPWWRRYLPGGTRWAR